MDLDITKFRAAFPIFSDANVYPDAVLSVQWDIASCYLVEQQCGCLLPSGTDCSQTMAWLMLAHLLRLGDTVSAGGTGTGGGAIASSARIDKVAVTLVPPPGGSDAWSWWLNGTPYGSQLLALLSVRAAGGFYAGGLPETEPFRKWGGLRGGGYFGGC